MALSRLGEIDRAFGGAGERRFVHLERGNLAAQDRIVELALRVAADRIRRDLAERAADAAVAEPGDHRALVLQQIFRDVPTAIDGADHMRLRHAHAVEEGFTERRLAGDQQDRLGRDALGGHVEQDEADAVVLLRGRIGAHQAEDPVGVVGVGGPDLLTGDDVIVAVAFGAGLQRGEVGAGVGLGVALAPADQAGGDLRQMLGLLFLGAVFQQRRPKHPDAEARQRRPRAHRRHFLAQHLGFGAVEAAAAVLLRPVRHGPALVAHPLEPHLLRFGGELGVAAAPEHIVVIGDRLAHLRRAIGL